jgi:2-polyprenyl-3-methyl-5-hydroxy-6-metoxy-1,4-benzoquinol methylase
MSDKIDMCPLCSDTNNSVLEEVNPTELCNKYKALTGIDLNVLFKDSLLFKQCNGCGLKFFDPKITGDQEFYESLQKFDWYYFDDKDEYSIAKEYVNEGDLVLDVGCGKGAFANHVFSKKGRFLGLDFSENAKDMAAKDGIEIKVQSVQDFASSNPESVDLVTSFQVCEHVSNVKDIIEAKLLSLKIGGRMIIAVPSEDSFLAVVTNGILNLPPHHVTRWPDKVFYFIAEKYNLELERIHHEILQDIHVHWYLGILIQNSILRPKLIDSSYSRKIVNKISALLSKVLIRGFKDCMKPNGHTVLAVFRKK